MSRQSSAKGVREVISLWHNLVSDDLHMFCAKGPFDIPFPGDGLILLRWMQILEVFYCFSPFMWCKRLRE